MPLLKKILSIGACVLMPLLAVIILIELDVYADYPFVRPAALTLGILLVLFPLWLMRGTARRLLKSVIYVLLVLLMAVLIAPQFWTVTPGFIGGRFAWQWYLLKFKGDVAPQSGDFIMEKSRYEKISDDAALFTYPDPPVTLLVSTANGNPHCTGYPPVAEQRCSERLREFIKNMSNQPSDR